MKNVFMKWVFMLSWLITALTSINIGLDPTFGFNFFRTDFFLANLYQIYMPLHYIILIAGLISLGLFVSGFSSTDLTA